ncbi:MAG: hypothetical protein H0U53_00810 [Actinobacteria bacterium]|nr:hypothetical protein [Actinomycetota bacterium]
MKKILVALLSLSLVVGALALPAAAKKKKSKPVATTLYAHGPNQLGEVDGALWFSELGAGKPPLRLDATEPGAGAPKSQFFMGPAFNDQCTGLPVAFPTFEGELSGTIVGDVKMTTYFVSAPGKIIARIWTDVPNFSCNDAYVEPASEVEIDVPAGEGEVEIVFPGLKQQALASVLVEILAPGGADYSGQVGRILYDSTDAATRLEFSCIPAKGSTSCTP